MNLIKSETVTMSSLDFLELVINPYRLENGETAHEPRKFLAKVEDELDLDPTGRKFRLNNNQTKSYYYDLNADQMLLVGMRESKKVRQRVLDHVKSMQAPAVPQTYAAALLEAGRLAQLAEDQAEKLALAAPKVQFVDSLVERGTLMTATQVGQKHKISAVKLNKILDEVGGIYSRGVKRSRVFTQQWIDKGYGEMKQTELGHSQALFTPAGEYRIAEILTSEGLI